MKKLLVVLFNLILFVGSVGAQEHEPTKKESLYYKDFVIREQAERIIAKDSLIMLEFAELKASVEKEKEKKGVLVPVWILWTASLVIAVLLFFVVILLIDMKRTIVRLEKIESRLGFVRNQLSSTHMKVGATTDGN